MKNRFVRSLIIGAAVVGIILLLRYLGAGQYFSLEKLKQNSDYFKELVASYYGLSVMIYIAVYTVVISCAIPAFAPLTIVGGFLFGILPAVLYSAISATLGSVVYFLLARYVLTNTVRRKYGYRLAKFNDRLKSHGVASYLLMVQFLTVVPYFIINTLSALADVPLWTFLWTTFIGSMPLLFVYAYSGRQLSTIGSVRDIFSPQIILMFIILILFAFLPMIIKRLRTIMDV